MNYYSITVHEKIFTLGEKNVNKNESPFVHRIAYWFLSLVVTHRTQAIKKNKENDLDKKRECTLHIHRNNKKQQQHQQQQ